METVIGRPRLYTEQDAPLKGISARLPFWHIRNAKKLGAGCLSRGIRKAIEIAAALEKRKK